MTIKDVLIKATTQLQKMYLSDGAKLGVPQKTRRLAEARLDAEVLLGHLLGWPREELLIHNEKKLTKKDQKAYQKLIKRRLQHEPIAYIIGKKEFYGLDFTVTKDVLIPRPETELLVDLALKECQELRKKYGCDFDIVDVGTGAGNIIISIAKNLKIQWGKSLPRFYAIDVSDKVLNIARNNAKNLLLNEIIFLKGNLLEPLPEKPELIVANLPYLPLSDWQKAPLDVKNWEPKEALLGGDDGLIYIFELLTQIKTKKYQGLIILLEIDPSQPKLINKFLKENFKEFSLEIFKDLAKFDRVAKIKL